MPSPFFWCYSAFEEYLPVQITENHEIIVIRVSEPFCLAFGHPVLMTVSPDFSNPLFANWLSCHLIYYYYY